MRTVTKNWACTMPRWLLWNWFGGRKMFFNLKMFWVVVSSDCRGWSSFSFVELWSKLIEWSWSCSLLTTFLSAVYCTVPPSPPSCATYVTLCMCCPDLWCTETENISTVQLLSSSPEFKEHRIKISMNWSNHNRQIRHPACSRLGCHYLEEKLKVHGIKPCRAQYDSDWHWSTQIAHEGWYLQWSSVFEIALWNWHHTYIIEYLIQ